MESIMQCRTKVTQTISSETQTEYTETTGMIRTANLSGKWEVLKILRTYHPRAWPQDIPGLV